MASEMPRYSYVAYMTFMRVNENKIPYHLAITSTKPPFKVKLFATNPKSPDLKKMDVNDILANFQLVPDYGLDPSSLKVDYYIDNEEDWKLYLQGYLYSIAGFDEYDEDSDTYLEVKIACVDEDTFYYLSGLDDSNCPLGNVFIEWEKEEREQLKKKGMKKLYNRSIVDRVVSSIAWQPYMQKQIDESTKDDEDSTEDIDENVL